MPKTIHFNTGRMYSTLGQRITATLHDDGVVTFHDHDRMVDGSFAITPPTLFSKGTVMHRYDSGEGYGLDRTRSWADAFMRGGCNSQYEG